MLVDSHCHLNFPELAANIDEVRNAMALNGVGHALCISVTLKDFPQVLALADKYPNFFASVGVHPDYESEPPFNSKTLVDLAQHPKVIAIGDPWLYNEYVDGRKLPKSFKNFEAMQQVVNWTLSN